MDAARRLAPASQSGRDLVDGDFATIRQLGFDTVLVRDLDPTERADVARSANRHGLHLVILGSTDSDGQPELGPFRRAALVNCAKRGADELSTARAWLLDYHLSLAGGRTAGVLFKPYRAAAGAAGGIIESDQPPSAACAAMIKQIALRARYWHTLLGGLDEPPIDVAGVGGASVRAVILFGGNRSCLLVVNPSLDRFVRRRIELSTNVTNPATTRAVQASAADQSPVGAVIESTGTHLSIPVELAPGDAALYELFAVRRSTKQ